MDDREKERKEEGIGRGNVWKITTKACLLLVQRILAKGRIVNLKLRDLENYMWRFLG